MTWVCVDWQPLFDFLKARQLDPAELGGFFDPAWQYDASLER